jgi:hypothetical protein
MAGRLGRNGAANRAIRLDLPGRDDDDHFTMRETRQLVREGIVRLADRREQTQRRIRRLLIVLLAVGVGFVAVLVVGLVRSRRERPTRPRVENRALTHDSESQAWS